MYGHREGEVGTCMDTKRVRGTWMDTGRGEVGTCMDTGRGEVGTCMDTGRGEVGTCMGIDRMRWVHVWTHWLRWVNVWTHGEFFFFIHLKYL